jgi:hypothetical protein
MRDVDRRGYEVRKALQIGELSEGGYMVPDEFEHTLVEALQEENIMRGLVHVITTSSGDRKIPLVTSKGAASWVEEEAVIPESDDSFGQISLERTRWQHDPHLEELLLDSRSITPPISPGSSPPVGARRKRPSLRATAATSPLDCSTTPRRGTGVTTRQTRQSRG